MRNKLVVWTKTHYLQLVVFNLFVLLMFLLRSAGYFHPFLVISVNLIVISAFIVAIFLLGARSRAFFLIALIFWGFASFLKIVRIDVWAERTGIYAFESLTIGVVLYFMENFAMIGKTNKEK